jgi:hypothetical protein
MQEPIQTGNEVVRLHHNNAYVFLRTGIEGWINNQITHHPNRLPSNPLTRAPISNGDIELYNAEVTEDSMQGGKNKKRRTKKFILNKNSKSTQKRNNKSKSKNKKKQNQKKTIKNKGKK